MFEKIAAIDIGSTSIKLIKARKKITSYEIISLSSEPVDMTIENHHTSIKLAIENIIKKNNIDNFHIVFNLPMEKTIIRNLTFPFKDIDKIAEALPFEAEENIPYKLEDIVLDFQLLENDDDADEARVLLAASHLDSVYDYLSFFEYDKITPAYVGLEANAMYECFNHFHDENGNIMQLDIGHNKTVINIISGKRLLFTRSLSIGTELIIRSISSILNIDYDEAYSVFEKLNLDIKDPHSNLDRHFYKSLEIPKAKMKRICRETEIIIDDFTEQLNLTVKSFYSEYKRIDFDKIIISGGGSNLVGMGDIISERLSIPVISLKFLPQFSDPQIVSLFATSFGLLLTYLYSKKTSINFLQGAMVPDFARSNIKQYYFPIFISSIALIFLMITLAISLFFKMSIENQKDEALRNIYKKYFKQQINNSDDPVKSANKLLNTEISKLKKYNAIFPSDKNMLELIDSVIASFESDPDFEMKDIVFNDKIIRISGEATNSSHLDKFKNGLQNSKKFSSVDLNTNISSNKKVRFNITIKLKQ